ncbi:hypothetical protein FXO37_29459 [Capsicum annuum]|nr:hypothetical protein FXO37_29459 [Capsicum annuum]
MRYSKSVLKEVVVLSQKAVEELGVYMVSFDRPGYGKSDPHPKRSFRTLALDVEELADQLELGAKFYVMGGSNSLDFRKHFKDLLDLHNPALVVLLETYRMNHQTVPNEFRFSNVAACPGLGTSGGIAILWQADLLNVTDVAMTHQEIYCRIQVIPFPNKWLFSVVYAFNNKNDRLTLWDNLKLVADNFVGPWSIVLNTWVIVPDSPASDGTI